MEQLLRRQASPSNGQLSVLQLRPWNQLLPASLIEELRKVLKGGDKKTPKKKKTKKESNKKKATKKGNQSKKETESEAPTTAVVFVEAINNRGWQVSMQSYKSAQALLQAYSRCTISSDDSSLCCIIEMLI